MTHFSLSEVHTLAGVDVLDGVELSCEFFVLEGKDDYVLLYVCGVGNQAELIGGDVEFKDLDSVHFMHCLVAGYLLK